MNFERPSTPAIETDPEISSAKRSMERLMEGSPFARQNPDSPNTTIELGERKFTVSSIENGEHPDVEAVQNLLVKIFGEEEVDPIEYLKSGIEGKTPSGEEDETAYRVHIVKDEEGNIVSMVSGGLMDLRGVGEYKSMYMVAYAVTDPDSREKGLAREAYISAIIDAARSAAAEGKELAMVAGECTYTSERFWNKVGLKRGYISKVGNENEYRELEYVQPAIEFNKKTGAVKKGAGEVPEHLMIDTFGQQHPTKEVFMSAIDAFNRWCYNWAPDEFSSKKAYDAHASYIQGIKDAFESQFEEGGKIILLDGDSREKRRSTGLVIEEYVAADQQGAGEEDF